MTAAKLKQLAWHVVATLTAVPFVHDYACRKEIDAMREIFDRWVAESREAAR